MYFFYKLIPPRPDFHLTMDEIERATMNEHKSYWAGLFEEGKVIVYGPVFDPNGAYGIAVIDAEDDEEATSLKNDDPAVASGICTSELFEMQAGMVR